MASDSYREADEDIAILHSDAVRGTGTPGLTVLVHGEAETTRAFADALGEAALLIPAMGDTLDV